MSSICPTRPRARGNTLPNRRTTVVQTALGVPVGFSPYGWGGAAGTYGSIAPENEITIFYTQHFFGREDLWAHYRIRNLVYSALI